MGVVTAPTGATAIKIVTNGRTLIDAVVLESYDGGANMDTYWDDYSGKTWIADWSDWRTVDGSSMYLIDDGTYVVMSFDNGPVEGPVMVTITAGQD